MSSVHKFRSLAAAVTIALAPAASFGVSFDINRDTTYQGGLTGAIVPDGTGDSVLYPFYTVYDGATTSFSLANTSETATIAAKVRFRDAQYSQDQLDFIVVLSPKDKFDFFVSNGGGVTTATWTDNSCVIGYAGSVYDDVKSLSFRGDYAGNPTGHVEVIGMLDLNGLEAGSGVDLDDAAKHAPLRNPNNPAVTEYYPENCGALKDAFVDRAAVNAIREEANGDILSGVPAALTRHDVTNDTLMGSMVVTLPGTGIEAGTDAIMVRNTFERGFLAAQSPNLCTGTGDPTTLQGTNLCYAVVPADNQEWDHPNLRDINWVGAEGALGSNTVAVLDELMTAQAVAGDWSNNSDLDVGTDWVIPFITKYVYMNGEALCNAGDKLTGYTPWPVCQESPFTSAEIGNVYVRGVDEETTTIPSPGIAIGQPDISNEVNVFTFSNESGDPAPLASYISGARETLRFSDSLLAIRGWAKMEIDWNPNGNFVTHQFNRLDGAVVVPLVWTVRATASPDENNGSLRGLSRINDLP